MKQQKPSSYPTFENVFMALGLLVIILSFAASVFSLIQNARFFHDPLDIVYYARHFLLIGGGFAIGYLLHNHFGAVKKRREKIQNGITFALFGYVIFIALDFSRLLAHDSIQQLGYPWGRLFFSGLPILSLLIAFIVYLLTLKWRPQTNQLITHFFFVAVILFIITQLFWLVHFTRYTLLQGEMPINWLNLGGLLLSPLIIALLSFWTFRRIIPRTKRVAYAVSMGLLYAIAYSAVWEFRINPELSATVLFETRVTLLLAITLIVSLVVMRKSLYLDTSHRKILRRKAGYRS